MTRVALIDDHESVRLGLEAACARAVTKQVVFSGSSVRTKYVEVGRPAPTKVDLLRRAMEDGLMPGHAGATRGDD